MPFGLDPDFLSVFNQALLVIPPLCLFQLPLHPRFSIFTWSVPLTPLPAFSWTFHSPTCWTRLLWSLFSLPQVELVDFRGTWDRLLLLRTQGCCLQFSLLHQGDMLFQVTAVSHSWISPCSWKLRKQQCFSKCC